MQTEERRERLGSLIKSLKINNIKFSTETGINRQYVSQMLTGFRPITEKTVSKIIKRYTSVNPQWLLNGTGYMYLEKGDPAADRVSEPDVQYLQKSDVLAGLGGKLAEFERRISDLEGEVLRLRAKVGEE